MPPEGEPPRLRPPRLALPLQRCPVLHLPAGLTLAQVKAEAIWQTVLANEGNVRNAAQALGISRRSLYPPGVHSGPPQKLSQIEPRQGPFVPCPALELPAGLSWDQIRERVIRATLEANRNLKAPTALALGLGRRTLYDYF
jgi:DNA-binding NtrC family response regulator